MVKGRVTAVPEGQRLQKVLSRAGVASRRRAEELIRAGRVKVNGHVAHLGLRVDPERDAVKVDGKRVELRESHQYLLLNKPPGVITTRRDPEGRSTVYDLVPRSLRGVIFSVGRLDYQTEGLLLLTSDGELAQRVAHPRYGCAKTYEVKVKGRPDRETLKRLRAGIVIDGRRTAPCKIRPHRPSKNPRGPRRREDPRNSWWTVELVEGRSRQIREMFFRAGHPVRRLRRVAIGSVIDRHLPTGAFRHLSAQEVEVLRQGSSGKRDPSRRAKTPLRRPRDGDAPAPRRRQQDRPLPAGGPLVVAIDGPSGVGKSTTARLLARRLGIPYLDTGAMYRAVGLEFLRRGADPGDSRAVDAVLQALDLDLRVHGSAVEVLLRGESPGDEIRRPETGMMASRVAACPAVRVRMVALQRTTAAAHGGVLEGRDIGTVVLPETPHKFFLEASETVRVERRYRELRARDPAISRDAVARELRARDRRDRERPDSPLRKDASYTVVDTSELEPEAVVTHLLAKIRGRKSRRGSLSGTPS